MILTTLYVRCDESLCGRVLKFERKNEGGLLDERETLRVGRGELWSATYQARKARRRLDVAEAQLAGHEEITNSSVSSGLTAPKLPA